MASCSYFPEDFDRGDYGGLTETNKYIQLGNSGTKGLIFYPGGLVDPFSYVDMLNDLVTEDMTVFIAKVPYNLSILDIDHAEGIRKSFTEIKEWSIMGHSLGGSVACFEVDNNIDVYENLILLASYPAASTDLKDFGGKVISIYGSQDKILDKALLNESKNQFSNVQEITDLNNLLINVKGSYFYMIEGGNHAFFGNYGAQNGDGDATISRTEQQSIVLHILDQIF
jgi:hypothetical protein